ncbi:TPA: helix-turn-helix domain-containing protein [Clostridium botulinum]|nr:helix-turn-helix domain-containing protein [Clostridium botulinum]
MKNISELGKNIKKLRKNKGFSSYKLAKNANVGISTISQIESGNRQSLNSNTIEKIATALEVSTGMLLSTNEVSDLGKNIKYYRENKNMSICDLAKLSNIEISIVSDIESGTIKDLQENILLKVASVLKVSVDELLLKHSLLIKKSSINIIEYISSIDQCFNKIYLDEILLTKNEINQLNIIIRAFKEVISLNRKNE